MLFFMSFDSSVEVSVLVSTQFRQWLLAPEVFRAFRVLAALCGRFCRGLP
jgi:hypothetical protein